MTNVQSHIHSTDNWLMRIDIKNFFPSISSESVSLIFEKLGYPRDVSRILSNLCTKDGKLCQGFSTSPVLANIYMIEFDSKLNSVIEKQNYEYNLVYTRYADDIIVSGLKISGYIKIVRDIRDDVEKILAESNLMINKRKTSIQKKERKKITGLYIENNNIILSNSYLKKFESEIYYCRKYGVLSHLRYHNILGISNFKGYMYGKAAFIKMVNPSLGKQFKKN